MEELSGLGVNTSEGLERVMGDQSLYEMMLGMFLDSIQDNPIQLEDFDAGELDDLIKRVHTLKGVTGNLSITPLFNSYTKVLGLLRDGLAKQARAGYQAILPVQEQIIDCIKRHKT